MLRKILTLVLCLLMVLSSSALAKGNVIMDGPWTGSDKDLIELIKQNFPQLLNAEPSSAFTQDVVFDEQSGEVSTMNTPEKRVRFSAYEVTKSEGHSNPTGQITSGINITAYWDAWNPYDVFEYSGTATALIHEEGSQVPLSALSLFRVQTTVTATHYTSNWGVSIPWGASYSINPNEKTLVATLDFPQQVTNAWNLNILPSSYTLLSGGFGKFTRATFSTYCSANLPDGSGGVLLKYALAIMDWELTYHM